MQRPIIRPNSIRSLGHYVVSGMNDKLRYGEDSDWVFNPQIKFASSIENALKSFDDLFNNHLKQEKIRSNRLR
jgi:hypothetical protein